VHGANPSLIQERGTTYAAALNVINIVDTITIKMLRWNHNVGIEINVENKINLGLRPKILPLLSTARIKKNLSLVRMEKYATAVG
jgi:hypothetical protein